ncbi:MAG: exodeoxyribonuclease III [Geminicoccaceae bacterium]|nr:exodeoxyribonuclease III [Geminicoccaceae bacterium]MDW8123980.1 exodeoxyribonuclease III [Geminicoccaceae bacterium]MDW8340727.1 exodeoxyribonuclease III [Geminicoccaceae bacterium]
MPTVATFNVNSIKARLPNLLDWLAAARPDVVCLQELKCTEEAFPREPIEDLGYNIAVFGQRGWNGVAILSRSRIEDVLRGLPGDPEDEQARYIEAFTAGIRVASVYVPNGNPVGSEKFAYKLAWLERLRGRARELAEFEEAVVLAGDFNVIPEPIDCHDPAAWAEDALFRPESRRALRAILHEGWIDAYRALHPEERNAYTFWDYQGGAFQLDHGIRIDHLLLSPEAADRLEEARIDKEPRRRPKASDHTPVIVRLRDG